MNVEVTIPKMCGPIENTAILIENETVVPRGTPTMGMRFWKKREKKKFKYYITVFNVDLAIIGLESPE